MTYYCHHWYRTIHISNISNIFHFFLLLLLDRNKTTLYKKNINIKKKKINNRIKIIKNNKSYKQTRWAVINWRDLIFKISWILDVRKKKEIGTTLILLLAFLVYNVIYIYTYSVECILWIILSPMQQHQLRSNRIVSKYSGMPNRHFSVGVWYSCIMCCCFWVFTGCLFV